jgi:hypothetical protein
VLGSTYGGCGYRIGHCSAARRLCQQDPPKQTVSALLRVWLASSPFQPPNGVHWHLTTLNGMRGVTFETNIAGGRALNYVLYKNGLVIQIRADASGKSAPVVWLALTDLARSFRANLVAVEASPTGQSATRLQPQCPGGCPKGSRVRR